MALALICSLLVVLVLTWVSYSVFPAQEEPPAGRWTGPTYTYFQGIPLSIIQIDNDGKITPSNAPIRQTGSIYSFTKDISNCTLEVQKDDVIIDGAGHVFQSSVQGNNYGLVGIDLEGRTNVTIKNVIIKYFLTGIMAQNSLDLAIEGNTLSNIGSKGIALDSCNYTIIKGNAENNLYEAVDIDSPATLQPLNINITGNTMTDAVSGIQVHCGFANSISENSFADVDYPVWVASNLTTISRNTMANGVEGIAIGGNRSEDSGYSTGGAFCSIFENQISNFSQVGIELDLTINSNIYENNIVNNGQGICVGQGSSWIVNNNTVYHNNFENNVLNVFLGSNDSSNFWNYGTVGNYWSDHTVSKSNQKGNIGNTSYVINSNNVDSYPQLTPFANQIPQNSSQFLWIYMEIGLILPIMLTIAVILLARQTKKLTQKKTVINT